MSNERICDSCGQHDCMCGIHETPASTVSTSAALSHSSRYSLRESKRNVVYTNMDATSMTSTQKRRTLTNKREDPERTIKRVVGDHWRRIESPRTDYTYAKSQSYHEKTPSPTVGNPNLSRESFKRSPKIPIQLKFSQISRAVQSAKYLVTSVVSFPILLVIKIFSYLSTVLISSVTYPVRYFRQTSQASTQSNQEFNASFKQLSDTQFPNGAPRNWARQQVVAERVASMNGGQTSSYSEVREDIQDVVVERHKEKIREIVVEKHLVQSPARWAVCGIPCWCWVPLILLPLLGILLSRERQETVLIHEGTVDSKWMNDLSARLTAAESQLKTACNTNTKDIQQLRDLVAAYQMKIKDEVAFELAKTKELLVLNNESVSLVKADIAAVKSDLQLGLMKQQRMLDESSEGLTKTLKLSLESATNKLMEVDQLRDRLEELARAMLNCDDCAEIFAKKIPKFKSESGQWNVDDINKLIAAAIWKYDNDKTGLPDYALEPAGGTVLSTRCSETYNAYTRKESVFGFPLWYLSYSPRTVIQPGVVPGECWAFKGSSGFLVLKLSGIIQVSSVSYEHISKSVSPDGHIDSAPRIFRLFGLMTENAADGIFMGEYTFVQDGPSLQNFPIKVPDVPPVPIIEFRIVSNHGHPVYTCLYRLRVHGKRIHPAYGDQ